MDTQHKPPQDQQHPVQQQTTLLQQVATKKHPFEPWKDIPCNCVHCGKLFPNNASKNSHLMHCKKRFLNRFYKVGDAKGGAYLFTIQWNPLKKRRNAIQKLINEFSNPQMLIGALTYLMNEGVVRNYVALPIEDSVNMLKLPNGRVMYTMLSKLLVEKELRLLEAQVETLNAEKEKFGKEGVVS
jgi:hypothetical protein